jgi:hypothetical protein
VSRRLKTLLHSNQELNPLLVKAQVLLDLQRHFIQVAPLHLGQTCRALGLQQGILSVSVANATIAAKLRQIAPELTTILQSRIHEISGIRITVQISYDSPPDRNMPRTLSKSAKIALNEFSQKLSDTPLKEALMKIVGKKI